MNKYLSIITLNVNRLNAPIKRHRVAEWLINYDPHICCPQETHLRTKDLQPRLLYTERLSIKMEGQIRSSPEKEGTKNIPPPNQPCKRC